MAEESPSLPLPESTLRRLERLAAARGVPVADLLRAAVEDYLAGAPDAELLEALDTPAAEAAVEGDEAPEVVRRVRRRARQQRPESWDGPASDEGPAREDES